MEASYQGNGPFRHPPDSWFQQVDPEEMDPLPVATWRNFVWVTK